MKDGLLFPNQSSIDLFYNALYLECLAAIWRHQKIHWASKRPAVPIWPCNQSSEENLNRESIELKIEQEMQKLFKYSVFPNENRIQQLEDF